MFMFMYVHVCSCMYIHVYSCMVMYVHVCMSMYAHVHVHVCSCMHFTLFYPILPHFHPRFLPHSPSLSLWHEHYVSKPNHPRRPNRQARRRSPSNRPRPPHRPIKRRPRGTPHCPRHPRGHVSQSKHTANAASFCEPISAAQTGRPSRIIAESHACVGSTNGRREMLGTIK